MASRAEVAKGCAKWRNEDILCENAVISIFSGRKLTDWRTVKFKVSCRRIIIMTLRSISSSILRQRNYLSRPTSMTWLCYKLN